MKYKYIVKLVEKNNKIVLGEYDTIEQARNYIRYLKSDKRNKMRDILYGYEISYNDNIIETCYPI